MKDRRVKVTVNFRGQIWFFTDLIRTLGLQERESTVRDRLRRGWPPDDAFVAPFGKYTMQGSRGRSEAGKAVRLASQGKWKAKRPARVRKLNRRANRAFRARRAAR